MSSTVQQSRHTKRKNLTSKRSIWQKRETWIAFLFLLPASIGFLLFYALPFIRGIGISFTDWDLVTDATFVGLENYQKLFEDDRFWRSLQVTLIYVLFNVGIQLTLALVLAELIHRFTNSIVVRIILILPYLLSNVVVALLWLWLLDPRLGIVNSALMALGFERQAFLGSTEQALASVVFINIWRHLGYSVLLFLAGMMVIPDEYYEAASIDGATEFQQFTRITLPLMRPVMAFVFVTGIIGSFQIFDTIAITTGGGPAGSTRVLMWFIYERAFERFDMGYASAAATVLFVILMIATLIQIRFFQADSSAL